MSQPDPNSLLSTTPRPGFVETFTNREARWRALAGSWETTPEGVRAAPGRAAAWYVCRAVRPPDFAVFEATLNVRNVSAQGTAAAAVSVITDQGHRALSAAIDVESRRLLLMGSGTHVLAEASLPDRFDPEASHRLTLWRNGPSLAAEVEGACVHGSLKRTITQGLLAFWTDPGVEATFNRLSISRGFTDVPPFSGLPHTWESAAESGGGWTADDSGFHFDGQHGVLVKSAGLWEDVQVSASVLHPGRDAFTGIGLRGQMQGIVTLTAIGSGAKLEWSEGGGEQQVGFEAAIGETATLTLRRIGRTAHVWVNETYHGAHTVPGGPAEIVLVGSGPSTVSRVSAQEWI